MRHAACTIVSANYLHYAWTLAKSFFQHHPEDEFHLLVVDQLPHDFVSRDTRVQLIQVEQLELPDFKSLAFKFDLLELNTGVKPTFIKHLFALGIDRVIYFDPDIVVFNRLDLIFACLDKASIVVTPHLLSPTSDQEHITERDILVTGSFNLGFIAVANNSQGSEFLDWWEQRCLQFCFQDLRSGLFVDQKWMDLAPSLFESLHILRHVGCNVAYWNLSERRLGENQNAYTVDTNWPLVFFHFSGYKPSHADRLSNKLRAPVEVNEPLRELLVSYGDRLRENGADIYSRTPYAYGKFSNGSIVSTLARRLYSATLDRWIGQDPFDADGPFFQLANKRGILAKHDSSGQYNSSNLPGSDWRVRAINGFIFSLPRLIGADRYTMLMKYLSFISILRNQRGLLFPADARTER